MSTSTAAGAPCATSHFTEEPARNTTSASVVNALRRYFMMVLPCFGGEMGLRNRVSWSSESHALRGMIALRKTGQT